MARKPFYGSEGGHGSTLIGIEYKQRTCTHKSTGTHDLIIL
jgi:hypothetical protein